METLLSAAGPVCYNRVITTLQAPHISFQNIPEIDFRKITLKPQLRQHSPTTLIWASSHQLSNAMRHHLPTVSSRGPRWSGLLTWHSHTLQPGGGAVLLSSTLQATRRSSADHCCPLSAAGSTRPVCVSVFVENSS